MKGKDIGFCYFCQLPVSVNATDTYSFASGWVRNRKDGGAHAIEMIRHHGNFAHAHCVRAAKHKGGPAPVQEMLI